MVRQATDTAVSASISTPVWPVTFAVARTVRPGSLRSGAMSTAILESAQRMAERDQLVRLLGRHDAGDPRGAEHVALLGVAREHEVERLWRHHDAAFGDGDALGRGLRRHVDHARFAAFAEMGELARRAPSSTPRRRSCAARAAMQRARGGLDIALAHQALADQEGRDADTREPVEIGRA